MADVSRVNKLAEMHVDWLVTILADIIRTVGIEEFKHGYKHGQQDMLKKEIDDDDDRQSKE